MVRIWASQNKRGRVQIIWNVRSSTPRKLEKPPGAGQDSQTVARRWRNKRSEDDNDGGERLFVCDLVFTLFTVEEVLEHLHHVSLQSFRSAQVLTSSLCFCVCVCVCVNRAQWTWSARREKSAKRTWRFSTTAAPAPRGPCETTR